MRRCIQIGLEDTQRIHELELGDFDFDSYALVS